MDRRRFVATIAVFIIAFISITACQEDQNNQTQIQENGNTTIVTNGTEPVISPQLKESTSSKDHENDDYEWNNTDDYVEYAVDDPKAYDPSIQPSNRRRNENRTRSNANETEAAGNANLSNGTNSEVSETNVTISSDSDENENASNSNATSNIDADVNKNETSVTEPASGEETEGPTTNPDNLSSSPSEASKTPSDIETQDVGDSFTNFTTPSDPLITEFDDGQDGLRALSVVVVSVLVSFAVIFTILYFIRGALIRKRRMDQRRLLRGSVSSEGYFYGDGVEPNTPSKFEF